MSSHYYLNPDKTTRPCSLMEWAKQYESDDRHVGENEVNGYRVSTIWLGLNHKHDDGEPPLIFETMVFDHSGKDIYCERYSTWRDAEYGHERAMVWVINGCKDDKINES